MHRRKVDGLFVAYLSWRGLGIDVADQRQLRKKFVHVFKLAGKDCELIQIFPAKFVVCEVCFGIIIVDGFDHGRDHFRCHVGLTSRGYFVQGMGELFPRLL